MLLAQHVKAELSTRLEAGNAVDMPGEFRLYRSLALLCWLFVVHLGYSSPKNAEPSKLSYACHLYRLIMMHG
jgi:hypothetical protein